MPRATWQLPAAPLDVVYDTLVDLVGSRGARVPYIVAERRSGLPGDVFAEFLGHWAQLGVVQVRGEGHYKEIEILCSHLEECDGHCRR